MIQRECSLCLDVSTIISDPKWKQCQENGSLMTSVSLVEASAETRLQLPTTVNSNSFGLSRHGQQRLHRPNPQARINASPTRDVCSIVASHHAGPRTLVWNIPPSAQLPTSNSDSLQSSTTPSPQKPTLAAASILLENHLASEFSSQSPDLQRTSCMYRVSTRDQN